jgi:signal transduction histidine kinase
VADRAHQIARGGHPVTWPRGKTVEFNRLSEDLAVMADAIQRREDDLRRLNDELEDRVAQRTADLTRSNEDLSKALATVEQAKDELIQSEKLAALGRLVAGVAHELNTPLGNGRIAITTLADKLSRFERSLTEGLRRSELESFVQGVQTSTDIAERNLLRASRLIASFKQVAADRTASRRRKFQLIELIDEVVLTVSPSMKRQPVDVRVSVPEDIHLDSYPGELGQALTNLIENCVSHAFKGREQGCVEIAAALSEGGQVTITLRDDGVGMTPEVAHRAFDPFFTTSLGSGGTGLGLFIAHNAITNVLGGTVTLTSRPGEGTCFELRLPLVAPKEAAGAGGAVAAAAVRPHQPD